MSDICARDQNNGIDEALRHLAEKDYDTALRLAQEALALQPDSFEPLFVIGSVAGVMGRLGFAIRMLEEGHRRQPALREFATLLAFYSARAGRIADALYYSKLALASEAHSVLSLYVPAEFADPAQAIYAVARPSHLIEGAMSLQVLDWERAEDQARQEIDLNPESAPGYQLLGRAFMGRRAFEQAITAFRAAIECESAVVEHRLLLGDALAAAGHFFEALEAFRGALDLAPADMAARLRLLAALDRHLPPEFAAVRQETARQLREQVKVQPAPSRVQVNSRMRVAYLVPDAAAEAFGAVLSPLLRSHDRRRVETLVLQQFTTSSWSFATSRIVPDQWREIFNLDDATLDMILRSEGIDVLVDLGGAVIDNRLAALAGHPVPVQLGWLAPGSADLAGSVYDAVLADQWTAKGEGIPFAQVAGGMLAYSLGAVGNSYAASLNSPVASKGAVTFGAKLDMARLAQGARQWSQVLASCPDSELCLGYVSNITSSEVERVLNLFGQFGVARQVRFQELRSDALADEMFWANIDILLEPAAGNDPGLLCGALSMGVPLVTWKGERYGNSLGESVLAMAGRSEWCADDPAGAIRIATALAADPAAVARLRGDLIASTAASRLCNVGDFAAALEDTYAALLA